MPLWISISGPKLLPSWRNGRATSTPNAAADALIDPDYAALSCFNIPEDLLATREYVEDLGAEESLFQDVWTNFKLA